MAVRRFLFDASAARTRASRGVGIFARFALLMAINYPADLLRFLGPYWVLRAFGGEGVTGSQEPRVPIRLLPRGLEELFEGVVLSMYAQSMGESAGSMRQLKIGDEKSARFVVRATREDPGAAISMVSKATPVLLTANAEGKKSRCPKTCTNAALPREVDASANKGKSSQVLPNSTVAESMMCAERGDIGKPECKESKAGKGASKAHLSDKEADGSLLENPCNGTKISRW